MKSDELKQVNLDIIFFFIFAVSGITSLYIIVEKKKNILGINDIDADTINRIYRINRGLILIVWTYFLLNSYNALKNEEDLENLKQDRLFVLAAFLGFLSALIYLPFGNSNVVIDE